MKHIEFRVRPVTRYNLTRYESGPDYGGVGTVAEFDNWQNAHDVAKALQSAEPGAIYNPCPEPPNELTASVLSPAELGDAIKSEIKRQRDLMSGGGSAC